MKHFPLMGMTAQSPWGRSGQLWLANTIVGIKSHGSRRVLKDHLPSLVQLPLCTHPHYSLLSMQRALGALAILASQVACKPLEQLQIRQVASTNSSFAAVVTPAPGDGSVLASNISVAADAGVVTALAAATVINEATTCSLSSVAEYTSTEFITLIDRTTPLYTLKVKPTIACECSAEAHGTPSPICQSTANEITRPLR